MTDLFSTSSLSDSEKVARLRLSGTNRVGPITYRHLLARYGSAEKALEAIPELSARGGKQLKPPPKRHAEKELAALARFGGEALFLGDGNYPARLAAIDDAPPVLFAKGHTHLLEKDIIGMVGARNANAAGIKMTRDLAAGLAEAGIVIASGLARGIDTAAHAASLQTGTIACIAGGLDIVYPRENEQLQDAIAAQGLILTEASLATRPTARHFPKRNRLISGISLGIVVVQAAKRSGSLITARQAGEQGREVFAVPGSPLDPQSQGANLLIRQGAKLTQTAEDVLEELTALRARAAFRSDRSAAFRSRCHNRWPRSGQGNCPRPAIPHSHAGGRNHPPQRAATWRGHERYSRARTGWHLYQISRQSGRAGLILCFNKYLQFPIFHTR